MVTFSLFACLVSLGFEEVKPMSVSLMDEEGEELYELSAPACCIKSAWWARIIFSNLAEQFQAPPRSLIQSSNALSFSTSFSFFFYIFSLLFSIHCHAYSLFVCRGGNQETDPWKWQTNYCIVPLMFVFSLESWERHRRLFGKALEMLRSILPCIIID